MLDETEEPINTCPVRIEFIITIDRFYIVIPLAKSTTPAGCSL